MRLPTARPCTQMRLSVFRSCMLLSLLTGSIACGEDIRTLVIVNVKDKPANVSLINAYVSRKTSMGMKDKDEDDIHSFSGTVNQFGLRLPAETSGDLSLNVFAGRGGCIAAIGNQLFSANGEPQLELSVSVKKSTVFDVCLPRPDALYGVWGSAEDDVWMVGANGYVGRWDGLKINQVPTGITAGSEPSFNSIWGVDANNVWIAGGSGLLLNYRSGSWLRPSAPAQIPQGHILFGVYGSSAKDIWAVGQDSAKKLPVILHVDGSNPNSLSWTAVMPTDPCPNATTLYSVFARAGKAWAVGDKGCFLAWDGAKWSRKDFMQDPSKFLNVVWGSAEGQDLIASGQDGKIYFTPDDNVAPKFTARITKGTDPVPLWSLWGINPEWTFLGGESGTLMRGESKAGDKWTSVDKTGIDDTLTAFGMWGSIKGGRLKHLWVVGSQKNNGEDVGGVYHYVDSE